jgi:hypothetical protein
MPEVCDHSCFYPAELLTVLPHVKDNYSRGIAQGDRRYLKRVAEAPDQAVFLKGWLKRVDRLDTYIEGLR